MGLTSPYPTVARETVAHQIDSVILENFAVKWVIEKAEVSEKNYSFDKLMELR